MLKEITVSGYEEFHSLFFHLRHYAKSNSPKSPNPTEPPQYTYSGSVNGEVG